MRSLALGVVVTMGLIAATADVAVAQYWYPHVDGLGYSTRFGGTVISRRYDGTIQRYDRFGNWQYYQDNRGTFGARYFDGYGGVTRSDYRNPYRGYRTITETRYTTDTYRRPPARRFWGW